MERRKRSWSAKKNPLQCMGYKGRSAMEANPTRNWWSIRAMEASLRPNRAMEASLRPSRAKEANVHPSGTYLDARNLSVSESPRMTVGCPTHSSCILLHTDLLKDLAPFQRLRACLSWWERNAPPFVVSHIKEGVEPRFQGRDLQFKDQKKSPEEVELALGVLAFFCFASEVHPSWFRGVPRH